MIIYQSTKQEFLSDALDRDIEEAVATAYSARTGSRPNPREFTAWRESLLQMARTLHDEGIPASCGVAIEYRIPQTSKRVDFILTGLDENRTDTAVIVELKQWSSVERTEKDGIVVAHRGGRAFKQETPHPCYQAWSYAALLKGFNEAVYDGGVGLRPCAYLHNYTRDNVIDHPFYAEHIARAPLFLKGDKEREELRAFIKAHVRYGDRGELLYRLEHGRIRPSKLLADSVVGLLQGKPEFVLVDDQKLVFETAILLAGRAAPPVAGVRAARPKQVLIVRGGPGTGKSVVALNLLAKLTGLQFNTRYVSKNAAPRAVYEQRLTGTFRKTDISNLFTGSGAFTSAGRDSFDVLVVDEAHRLNERSGLYGNLGENQIKEILLAARCTIFFVDDDQLVTMKDVGSIAALRQWAGQLGAEVTEMELASQFRCNGSDGYLAWLGNTLAIRPTENQILDSREFDFRVLDSPVVLHELIEEKNAMANRARVVAGYCWEWKSKREAAAWDIEIEPFGYRRRWNLTQDGSLWIVSSGSVAQVGCIHTCQGLELDYVGVIIGSDLRYEQGRIVTDPAARARSDRSLSGYKKLMQSAPEDTGGRVDSIIKNTYRTLMTRGLKGCYVYCVDPALAVMLRQRIAVHETPAPRAVATAASWGSTIPFRRLTREEKQAGANAVPLVNLRIAAGAFSALQTPDPWWDEWVELPEAFRAQPGYFVAQVVGESMNRRIRNGAWCLFRAASAGSRQGRIVVAQHREIHDPDLGGHYTIKQYFSEKVEDPYGGWQHQRIELRPDSTDPAFQPIVINADQSDELAIVAEWVATLT